MRLGLLHAAPHLCFERADPVHAVHKYVGLLLSSTLRNATFAATSCKLSQMVAKCCLLLFHGGRQTLHHGHQFRRCPGRTAPVTSRQAFLNQQANAACPALPVRGRKVSLCAFLAARLQMHSAAGPNAQGWSRRVVGCFWVWWLGSWRQRRLLFSVRRHAWP